MKVAETVKVNKLLKFYVKYSLKSVNEYLTEYELGNVISSYYLQDAFESSNFVVETDRGKFLFRFLFNTPEKITRGAILLQLFVDIGISTPLPVLNRQGKYFSSIDETTCIFVQTFIEGSEDLTKPEYVSMIEEYGKAMGRFHRLSSTIEISKIKPMDLAIEISHELSYIDMVAEITKGFLVLPDSEYIRSQHKAWLSKYKEITKLMKQNKLHLTKCLIHGDAGPGTNILSKNGIITGFIDLMGARNGFVLYDIGSFMMYGGLYAERNGELFKRFITSYLAENPIREELKYIGFFLKARFLLQVLFFTYRILIGYTQGVDNEDDNQTGYNDGVEMLEVLEGLPSDYFEGIIDRI